MILDENWGIPIARIREFFLSQPDVTEEGKGFRFNNCRITLTPITGFFLGPWEMPRTQVRMEGDDTDVQTIHRRFYLRFLSAGG